MKYILLAISIVILSGCATISLRENIRETTTDRIHQVSMSNIDDGGLIVGEYIGTLVVSNQSRQKQLYPNNECRYFKSVDPELFIIVDTRSSNTGYLKFTDVEPIADGLVIDENAKGQKVKIQIYNKYPKQVLFDRNDGFPTNFVLSFNEKERYRLESKVLALTGDRLEEFYTEFDFARPIGSKIANNMKNGLYVVSVPFDVLTSPIQFVLFLVWIDGMRHMGH